ncbi:MAG: bifunctional metallophosphatase/5'-nucleotidase [Thermoanaerobaculales bacterium]|jgi:2',3'-cyclic-nucleotide 2'-phosphodiesterase/3'-nucleotidase|nr:bifunctional metallophosphatase/5'-nucleotidase [Thermoanaerobaculales bacterium]
MTPTFKTLGALALGVGLAAATGAEPPDTARLTVLHTSDLHGSVLPFDDQLNRASDRGSLAQVATLVTEIRAAADHPVLVLDSGDTIQGTPFEQFVHLRWSEPSPTIAAMNRIGYQAMAVGNHEFNFGLEPLRRAGRQAGFPFLAANCVRAGSDEPAFQPYTILEVGPLKVGVLGLITPNVPGWEQPENYAGLEFLAMDDAARRWLPVLRGDEGCDLVVVLAHTGFERDPETGDPDGSAHENFAWRLSEVPGIDVLLTGHTHRDIPPRELHGVIVAQPGARASHLTRIDLELERENGSWRIASWEGRNLASGAAAADGGIADAMAEAHHRVAAALDGPAGEVSGEVRVERCRLADCEAVDLLHAVQLEATGAQLSLAALLNAKAPPLAPGPVSWRWIHAFYVYPNSLLAVRLTGAQVRDVLEHTARFYDGLECPPAGGCTVLTDPAIPHYNVDTMAGLSYRIDPTAPEGARVRDLRFEGRPLRPEASFTVALNSYRAAGGGMFPHLAAAEVVWRSSTEMSELIGDYLARHRPWQPVADGNWVIGRDLAAEEPIAGP